MFGPVMTVLAFRDEREVVERANGVKFGLAAGVMSGDFARCNRVHFLRATEY